MGGSSGYGPGKRRGKDNRRASAVRQPAGQELRPSSDAQALVFDPTEPIGFGAPPKVDGVDQAGRLSGKRPVQIDGDRYLSACQRRESGQCMSSPDRGVVPQFPHFANQPAGTADVAEA